MICCRQKTARRSMRGRRNKLIGGEPTWKQQRLCAHPDIMVPDCDTMVAKLLMLQTDEKQFLATANHTRLR